MADKHRSLQAAGGAGHPHVTSAPRTLRVNGRCDVLWRRPGTIATAGPGCPDRAPQRLDVDSRVPRGYLTRQAGNRDRHRGKATTAISSAWRHAFNEAVQRSAVGRPGRGSDRPGRRSAARIRQGRGSLDSRSMRRSVPYMGARVGRYGELLHPFTRTGKRKWQLPQLPRATSPDLPCWMTLDEQH